MDPAILLLDDPTAAVDAHTEQDILAAMTSAMRGRTTFLITHRISALRHADFILALQDGCIVQRGTHEELLRVPGPYRRVARIQVDEESHRLLAGPSGEAMP
jgi:ATP-binding cassette subfamily B protein